MVKAPQAKKAIPEEDGPSLDTSDQRSIIVYSMSLNSPVPNLASVTSYPTRNPRNETNHFYSSLGSAATAPPLPPCLLHSILHHIAHRQAKYRTGETCGLKLVYETITNEDRCKLCYDMDKKYRRLTKMQGDVARWCREGNRKATIERTNLEIQEVNRQIQEMNNQHWTRVNLLA
ncbi:uncharacterized protein CLUP02_11429 [Colletotrichum lupini]|uniref:Uncharacterized protein n=1 Tax=Colletotrichum lupini TaxID=145971 RepID=A0A9Q8SZE5_9PEZI|nr:uncharacterized protein CLUP02_11429 [Colletotrichum lupini]UQC85930.1 hypothetical protein CLUP02_11429 [Colletotrichum lupini]